MSLIGIILFSILIFYEYEQLGKYESMIGKTYTYSEEIVHRSENILTNKLLVGLYGLIYSIVGAIYFLKNKNIKK